MESRFQLGLDGHAYEDCIVQGEHYRFTVLTERMLRMEYSEDGVFEDRPTQIVWNRKLDHPKFTVTEINGKLEIDTPYFHMVYDKKEFNQNHLYIDVKYGFTNYGGRWYYGRTDYGDPKREHNLKGTARTLDRCDGEWYIGAGPLERMRATGGVINRCDGDVDLGRGLCDTSGRTFFEDANSLIMLEDGFVEPRKKGVVDTYFMGYGRDYFAAIHDFYRLSGSVPMLPKYILGNWWSRYWKYTEDSYMELLERFEKLNIPFSVVVMDMDWHIVDVPQKYGRGWTGYTWNKDFFPDPKRFLNWLHDHNYKITLNLHPADGVRAFEEQYPEMAEAMHIDPNSEIPVQFDFTNQEFINAYFKYLHHPNEKDGVDFWWMDWQQGNVSAVEGMDPLWMLNHYHHYDLKKPDKRGVMLSRYSGLGSHRYPIGFSGDTHITWNSLQYQPYFTITAANVGYTWWSHDIGGHLGGLKDNELYVRWLQFGAFSPINRLHSNTNPFCGKEPWRYPEAYGKIAADTLRLRHRMLPYIYTMNYQCHEDMVPVIVPAYYYDPMHTESYLYRNEYFFGTELLVQPMVHETEKETGRTFEQTWIPKGIWTDVYHGKVYHGGKEGKHMILTRPIEEEGILAKAGAIVPMDGRENPGNDIGNPDVLDIYVFPGADNHYELFEDCGDGFAYENGQYAKLLMDLKWNEDHAEFSVKMQGDASVLPENRTYRIHFRGFNSVAVETSSQAESGYCRENHTLTVTFDSVSSTEEITVTLDGMLTAHRESMEELQEKLFALLDGFQSSTNMRKDLYQYIKWAEDPLEIISNMEGMKVPESWKTVLIEILTA